jgi:putative transposase
MLAAATDRELARHVQYLKTENRILRAKLPERITVTAQERLRLLKFGKPVGKAIRELISIVTPRTFARWLSGESSASKGKPGARPGRRRPPRISANLCCGWRARPAGATRASSVS